MAPVEHSPAFRRRRFLNWFPLGLAYALLYMGRYNLTVAKTSLGDLMTKEDFGVIFAAGTTVYAFAFLFNGPLVDRIGGRKGMLTALLGSGLANAAMGVYISSALDQGPGAELRLPLALMYAVNMYFQSFAAVSIVKVNAHWFHVRERGGFSGIFGTMISSGIFFAFTGNGLILDVAQLFYPGQRVTWLVFAAPSALLFTILVVEFFLLRDRPGLAGHEDFDTGDASSGEDDAPAPTGQILKKILTNPIILTVAGVEFCTGVLRNGVMHWFPIYAKEVWTLPGDHSLVYGPIKAVTLAPLSWVLCDAPGTGPYADTLCKAAVSDSTENIVATLALCFLSAAVIGFFSRRFVGRARGVMIVVAALLFVGPFFPLGWGGLLFVAGVVGGNVAGWVSDLFFQSRRAPAAGGLYAILALCTIAMLFTLGQPAAVVAEAGPATQLLPGDKVLRVDEQPTETWADVADAVRCHVPACVEARWNPKSCVCESGSTSPATTSSPLSIVVERDGQPLTLTVDDPKASQRAGDKRKLQARPELPLSPWWLGVVIFLMSLCVIGTHGLLSGTATMDFGGRKGAATAVGIIDGFVYLGTAVQSLSLGALTGLSWAYWPVFLLPFSVIGFVLLLRIWNAKAGQGGH